MDRDQRDEEAPLWPKAHRLTPEQVAAHKASQEAALDHLRFAAFLATYGDDRATISPEPTVDPEPDHDALSEGAGGI